MGKEARLHKQKRENRQETYRGTAPQKLVIIEIAREDVQSGSTGTTASFLGNFVRRHGLASLLRDGLPQHDGSLGFLGFSFRGYDTDQREIWEIPEVRSYVQALLRVFPLFPFLLVDQAETVRGQGSPLLASGANLFFLTGFEPEQSASVRHGVMISNSYFWDSLRTLADSAVQHGSADFCGNDPNFAEVLPGLLDAKSWRLFSQATGFPVRKGEKVTFMPSHAGKSYMQCSATRGNFPPF
ncbi:protein of unknown function [Acidithiobacillus ferrivorans]|uniref:Uncharacterized protein n=1 Tax=Acidithiobacillus ferrivorans TaxID=160808 RepID=A0A060UQ57_9PROT|nr:hypothetical protein AFERRI_400326 [Acidithiobacillus ferrivorans]SMH64575.1 protein of unknown function [Acidithiobacillus ferrivorans]